MSQGAVDAHGDKRMRLRYAGACRLCGLALPAGQVAIYERAAKTVRCETCPDADPSEAPPKDASGTAGASARREHERRRDRREAAVRAKHPRLGGLILAVQDEPQSTAAWATGAEGEERLGARLDAVTSPLIQVLHDRRIPGTRANIDHVVVCPTGVVVIDTKKYAGRPRLRVDGGLLRTRTERLVVGGRDRTGLVDGVLRQVELVSEALVRDGSHVDVPVRGMLCFVAADWPVIGGSFTTRGVEALWPKRAVARLHERGPLTPKEIRELRDVVAAAFPIA